MELETHLELTVRLGYLAKRDVEPLMKTIDDVNRMLTRLIRALRESK